MKNDADKNTLYWNISLQRVHLKNNFFYIMTFLLKLSLLILNKKIIVWTTLKKYLSSKKLFSFRSTVSRLCSHVMITRILLLNFLTRILKVSHFLSREIFLCFLFFSFSSKNFPQMKIVFSQIFTILLYNDIVFYYVLKYD